MGLRLGNSRTRAPGRSDSRPMDYGFAAFRIALGAYWLYEQHWKLPPDFGLHQPRGLMFAFQQGIQYPTLDLYRRFLQELVVPNFHVVGWLVFVTEVAIGLSLVLGLFTRGGALMGIGQAINLLISQASTPEGPWIYLAILVANLLVLFTPSNRRLSVDQVLAPRLVAAASRGRLLPRLLLWLM